MDYKESLRQLKPTHQYFIGIDSDGCVFDTMEVKQRDYFLPAAIECFRLDEIKEVLSETWEFVNLYSVFRGGNRYKSLIKVVDLLGQRNEVRQSSCILPDLTSLRRWVEYTSNLSISSLQSYIKENNDPTLNLVLNWSEIINKNIGNNLQLIPPFKNARIAIDKMSKSADLVVISQTPLENLTREWHDNELIGYIRTIAAQEHGTKTEHISLAAKGKYPDNKILMIGDAPGDFHSAESNNVLFFPIVAGREEESWERFNKEGFTKFISGDLNGDYYKKLIKDFHDSLPEKPGWGQDAL